jgi:membrane protease YdiL (CAAX protease family)
LTSRLRAFGWALAFLGSGFACSVAIVHLFRSDARLSTPAGAISFAALQTAVLLLVFGVMTWAAGRQLRLRAQDFGLRPFGRGARGFLRGLGLGSFLGALSLAAAVPIGGAAWHLDAGNFSGWLKAVAVFAAVFFPAAFAEELAFRGVPLVVLSRAAGRRYALLVLSLLFSLAHLFNPGVTPLAMVNIVVAGVFLGLVFLSSGGLWASTGAHFGWNVTLSSLGAAVSGFPVPLPALSYVPGHPVWLTGGPFGPEGGVVATLCLVLGCLLAGRHIDRKPLT